MSRILDCTQIHAPSCIRDLGPVKTESGAEAREFEVRLKIRCPPTHTILSALVDFRSFYDQHPHKEALPNEQHDETIGGGTDTILG